MRQTINDLARWFDGLPNVVALPSPEADAEGFIQTHVAMMKTMDLHKKVVLTTGASSGIGAAIAQEAAARGATSILVGRNAERLAGVESSIRSRGGCSRAYVANLTSAREVELLRSRVSAEIGVPDILINNAGSGRWAYLDECSYDEIDETVAAPLHAALYVTRAFLPQMLERGSGAIANVTFIGAFLPWPGATGCTAVRWGMRGLHEAMRADLLGTNLSTTLIAASAVETEYWHKNRTKKPITPVWMPILRPDAVASASLDALSTRKSVLILPKGVRLLRALHFLMPGWVDHVMRQSTGLTRESQNRPSVKDTGPPPT
jgi:NADP-dependent 3-hydroxy acid dehydrogenase YdfG